MPSSALGIVLGILVGLRHAFEPDHLTAVSTLVTETHGPRTGALLGVMWGIGHTLALVAVGVILMAVGQTLPPRAAVVFELGVAAMLVVLGVRAIAIAIHTNAASHAHAHPEAEPRTHIHAHAHAHPDRGSHVHTHVHVHAHVPAGGWRAIVVGLVHGLAGSGALTALVFARLPSTDARILYMVLFGLGSVAGMAIASGVAGAALKYLVHSATMRRRIAITTGSLSIVVGILWSIPLVM